MVSTSIWAHGGGLNKKGCHNNTKTGDYHCHKKDLSKTENSNPSSNAIFGTEAQLNLELAKILDGQTEVNFSYSYGLAGNRVISSKISVDILTDKFSIEGGLDKRTSLDSIQQAVLISRSQEKYQQLRFTTPMEFGGYISIAFGQQQKSLEFYLFGLTETKL